MATMVGAARAAALIAERAPATPIIVVAPLTDAPGYFEDLCEGVVRCNVRWLKEQAAAGYPVPTIRRAGVRYKTERREAFLCIPAVLMRGWGDCDDLACWWAAELRYTGKDKRAKVYVRKSRSGVPGRYHAVVQRSDGTIDDPSIWLGMGA